MLPTCPDADLDRLATTIVSSATIAPSKHDQYGIILTIKNMKRYLATDARKLIGWAYDVLQQRTPTKA
ncbi:hypothetical protein RO3G_11623 [Lichtheimia corymbifera JMRC:FSU:9682]|uniref:Uncharacterized protein n=1 Tax=Lichtheimia corymbifera JMRC:FSU:9682 TaxID=1263082 RepID=A0A068RU28_9FUNG|nr:hypothetical protein RO3G_11623 [Lichtheimia corymbifera JMRC:FSU:9682]